jgi:hypothetical protein
MRTYYEKAFAVPLALKLGNSFVSASHWLLTQADFRRSEDAVCPCPGGGEDRHSRGGLSRGGSHGGCLASTVAWACPT